MESLQSDFSKEVNIQSTSNPPTPSSSRASSASQQSFSAQNIQLSSVVQKDSKNHGTMLLSIECPDDMERNPIDIVVVIDVSGSMGDAASSKQSVEECQLSILDIVKHATKTIIATLQPNDRVCIVAFSDYATVKVPLTYMTDDNKKVANEMVDDLVPLGGTNLWVGLNQGLTELENGKKECLKLTKSYSRNSTIFILTDGVPNIDPPKGYVDMLQSFKQECTKKVYPGTINTFGFGYCLQSKLLNEIAIEGEGMYYFIPDGGYVGTTFINALANELSVMIRNCSIQITSNRSVDVVGHQSYSRTWLPQKKFLLKLGSIQFGQRRDFVFKCQNCASANVQFTFQYQDVKSDHNGQIILKSNFERESIDNDEYLDLQRFRAEAVDYIILLQSNEKRHSVDILSSQLIKSMEAYHNSPRIDALLQDLKGQVCEATSNSEYFTRWGQHYLPCLLRAHSLQLCTNFKDPGLQAYGGPLTAKLRDIGEDIFCALPPPVGSIRRYDASTNSAITSATFCNNFYNSQGSCFAHDSDVTMFGGTQKKIQDIVKGDLVQCYSEFYGRGNVYAEVICIVKTIATEEFNGMFNLVELPESRLLVTPYHPIYNTKKEEWYFPCTIVEPTLLPCKAIYSFVLGPPRCQNDEILSKYSHASSMIINGEVCITLAHGITNDEVAAHSFFGTEAVITKLKSFNGFESGLVVMKQGCLLRDEQSNLVIGFTNA